MWGEEAKLLKQRKVKPGAEAESEEGKRKEG